MALKPCKECKAQISTDAKTCPQCGKKNPTSSAGETLLGFVGVVVLCAVAIKACGGSDSSPPTSQNPAPQAAADPASQALRAAAEAAACRSDLSCWAEQGVVAAGVYCRDPVERLAKHSMRWVDGTFEQKFSRYRWADKEAGTVTYLGDMAEFQNGFGAYTRVTYSCELAADHKTVLKVDAVEGRLPA